jgi:nitrile hydratase accessory protein
LSAAEASRAAFERIDSIPRDVDGPVFPAPWAARAFALAVALNERGLFTWAEWSETLGPKVAIITQENAADPEAYWKAWLAALEEILGAKKVAGRGDLLGLKEAWRRAAEATPHGKPIEPDFQSRR